MAKNTDEFEEDFDATAPILTDKEIADAKAKARADIMAAKKKDAREKLIAAETKRLQTEEGLTTGNAFSDEIVNITIDLPIFCKELLINQVPYHQGRNYSVPRHVADTLRDMMFRAWEHQSTIEGKSKSEFYAQKHVAELYRPGAKSAATLSARSV